MSVNKKIGLVCLSIAVLYPVALLFGVVKPALLIAFTGTGIKFLSGDEVLTTPLRFAVARTLSVTAVSFLSILLPITTIPVVILVLALCGIIILADYWTTSFIFYSLTSLFLPLPFLINPIFT
jgi:type III secretory pathway component EscU